MRGCSDCATTPGSPSWIGSLARAVVGVSVGLTTSLALAAVPVVESRSSESEPVIAQGNPVTAEPSQPRTVEGASGVAAEGTRLSTLYYQIQLMQEELRQLRGQVEEQQFVIDRLRRDQREQYLDLDGRVSALSSGGSVSTSSPEQGSSLANEEEPTAANPTGNAVSSQPASRPISTRPTPARPIQGRSVSTSASAGEQQSYNAAIALMRDKRFDDSVDAFNQLVVDYPNGALTPNAFYWLGELYLAKNELEQSRQSFTQVMNLYPDHRKVPDAIYKLGVVFSLLGDSRRSLELLRRVQTDYPGSSAAGLADSYAAELQ